MVAVEVVGMIVLETGGLKVAKVLEMVMVMERIMVFGVMVEVVMVEAVNVAMRLIEEMGWM